MEKDPKNKVVIVTGGAEGIGYAFAEFFLTNGAKVVIILDVNETLGIDAADKLNETYGEGKAVFYKCDVSKDLNAVSKKIFQDYPVVDVLINNAGIVNEYSPRRVLEINVIGTVEWSLKFFEHMRKDKGGRGGTIINLGSLYSFVMDPYMIIYKASKHAVMGFSKSLGHEDNYKKFGVRVLLICPGLTKSSMTRRQLTWNEHVEDFERQIKATNPEQETDDVGKVAIDIFQKANSGSAWTIIAGVPEERKQNTYYI